MNGKYIIMSALSAFYLKFIQSYWYEQTYAIFLKSSSHQKYQNSALLMETNVINNDCVMKMKNTEYHYPYLSYHSTAKRRKTWHKVYINPSSHCALVGQNFISKVRPISSSSLL